MANQTLKSRRADTDQKALGDLITGMTNNRSTWTATRTEAGKIAADPMRGFQDIGEFLTAVRDAGGRSTSRDRRLQVIREISPFDNGKQLAAGSDEAGIYSDPYGGFLVPAGLSPTGLSLTPEFDPTVGRTTDLPMEFPELTVPARRDADHSTGNYAGTLVTRHVHETQSLTSSQMELISITLKPMNLYGFTYASEELVGASRAGFVALLTRSFNEGFGAVFLREKIRGLGVGEFIGILNAAALITVAKESGQAADTFLYKNVIKMRMRCWGYSQGVWLSNPNCGEQLADLVSPNGNPIYRYSEDEDKPDMLAGRPIFYTEHCSTLGDVGDLVLCSWPEYLVGRLQEFQGVESIHVRFLNHERAFKFSIARDGMPWWKEALTPANGSDTMSPYVTLAERA